VPLASPLPPLVQAHKGKGKRKREKQENVIGRYFTGNYQEYTEPVPEHTLDPGWEAEILVDDGMGGEPEPEADDDDDLLCEADLVDDVQEEEQFSSPNEYLRQWQDIAPPTAAVEEERPLWSRSAVQEALQPDAQDFIFQHIDTTYAVTRGSREPVIRVWGCTRDGHSVMMQVGNFKPYFYAQLPDYADVGTVRRKMDAYLATKDRSRKKLPAYVLSVIQERKRSIRGYHRDADLSTMYKFVMAQPGYVAKARDALEFANRGVIAEKCATYEGNVPFALRYMVDSKLGGCQWIKLPASKYKVVSGASKASTCQLEVRCDWQDVVPIPTSDESQRGGELAPMRVLSFDIEVYRKERGFPKAEENPVITICAALSVIGKGISHKAVFTTAPRNEGCQDVPDATMYICDSEEQLLTSFARYVRECDPDAFTGWNIENFDWPYLFKRAEVLGLGDDFECITRVAHKKAYLREKTFNSKAYGARKSYELMCDGRFNYDGLTFMLRGQMTKYRSYKLNAISQEILGDSKVDVGYDQIPILYDGSDEDRGRLAWYCLKDSLLPLELLDKLMAFINGIEQSRVTGVPLKWLLSRGQGIKTFSNLLRYKEDHEVVPSKSSDSNSAFTAGGHVEEPIRGYYTVPIATLDFASLYPSIMIAYNICYSTKESLAWARKNLKEDDYWVPPRFSEDQPEPNFCFVKAHIREGILPKMLKDLLGARKNVKGMMKGAWKDKEALAKWLSGDRDHAAELKAAKDALNLAQHAFDNAESWDPSKVQDARKWLEEHKDGIGEHNNDTAERAKDVVEKEDALKEAQAEYEWLAKFEGKVTTEELARVKLLYAVLDGRQLALKVVCNSVYGFLKAFILTDKDLMSSVTSWGRWMIMKTKEVVEKYYSKMRVEVDRVACAAQGISPEWEPGEGQDPVADDPRPWRGAYCVYGDTDSVMVNFGDISLDECMRLGEECSEIATKTFVSPNLLEFESVKIRSLFLNKKRYAALELEGYKYGEGYESACKRAKLNCKGLESKRRDNAPIGGGTQKKVLELILRHGDVEGAEAYVKGVLEDILMDRVDMSQYVITKGLSKTVEQYAKGGTKQQHVELGKKQRARGEESAQTGDRVPFVMIKGTKGSKAYERVEDPIYAQQNGVPIDKQYYISKQVMSACLRVFTGVWAPHQCKDIVSGMKLRSAHAKKPKVSMEETMRYRKMYGEHFEGFNDKVPINKHAGEEGKVYLDDLVAYKRLFASSLPHMRRKKVDKARTYEIGSHTFKRNRCMGCGSPMDVEWNDSPVCIKCTDEEPQLREEVQGKLKKRKTDAKDAWDRCRECQGLPEGADLLECSNLICDNFFHRNRVLVDVEDLGEEYARFTSGVRPIAKRPMVITSLNPRPRKKRAKKKKKKKKTAPVKGTLMAFFGRGNNKQ